MQTPQNGTAIKRPVPYSPDVDNVPVIDKSPSTPKNMNDTKPFFNSPEEEKAYFARKAEKYKTALSSQVSDLKSETGEKIKTGALVGGALLASTLLVRAISGRKSKWVESSDYGKIKVKSKESFLWSLAKGAALLGIGYLAKDSVKDFVEKNAANLNDGPHTESVSADNLTEY